MATSNSNINLYGIQWPKEYARLDCELECIRRVTKVPNKYGIPLWKHYQAAQKAAWPEDDTHRWSDLILRRAVEEEIVCLVGCSDSSKTYSISKFALIDWWAFPNDTLWLISSTEYRGAELRIWGAIKQLYNRAKKVHPHLAGNVLESAHAISTEGIDDDRELARSLQRGMIVVPMKKGGQVTGLSGFVGVKCPRLRHAGDEVSLAPPEFLDAYANLYGKTDFKGCLCFNPIDITDPGCVASEPEEGWENFIDTGKTQEWRAKWFGAWVIALDGRDSPNADEPTADGKPKYPYLISSKKLDAVAKTFGKDSWQWYSQCVGKPNKGMALWRIVTHQMCETNHAFDTAQWRDNFQTTIYALDPAYGGGDRCAGMWIEFGKDINDREILCFHPPENIPISLAGNAGEPEEQIARYVKARLTQLGIGPENCFYDSFGRGTLGFYFSQVFGSSTPVPVDSGSRPTERPVRYDLFVDEPNGARRLKRCDEHYSKFVSEMWFSVAEAIQSGQVREFPKEVMTEMSKRIYGVVLGNKIEVEPKSKYKERVGKSPDWADVCAVSCEGARQRGFRIERIGASVQVSEKSEPDWLELEAKKYQDAINDALLTHV